VNDHHTHISDKINLRNQPKKTTNDMKTFKELWLEGHGGGTELQPPHKPHPSQDQPSPFPSTISLF